MDLQRGNKNLFSSKAARKIKNSFSPSILGRRELKGHNSQRAQGSQSPEITGSG
jgi:hypothetical protein